MKKILNIAVAAVIALGLGGALQAQTSIQPINFSLFAQYQTNIYTTNQSAGTISSVSRIRDILIGTSNVVKAIAVDLDGTNTNYWDGSTLVREVNLATGTEGMFLRKNGTETNVSSFFGTSYSNNFTAGVAAAFPAAFNLGGATNLTLADFELFRGNTQDVGASNAVTTANVTAGLYFVSLDTANLKFACLGNGIGGFSNVVGSVSGTRYSGEINNEIIACVGSFSLNVTSNIFDVGTNTLPFAVTGPLRGPIVLGQPHFSIIAGP